MCEIYFECPKCQDKDNLDTTGEDGIVYVSTSPRGVLSDERGKPTVRLNKVIEANSKNELLDGLAQEAANTISKRKIFDVVSKITKDCKLAINHQIADDLKGLKERRNKIVHEGKLEGIAIKDVQNGFGQVLYLLYVLGEAAIKYELPLLDDVGFMSDFREKLEQS